MLEQPELLIGPWMPDAGATAALVRRKRLIQAPASGEFLGLARASRPRSWLSWFQRGAIQVLETEDASLLMTVYSPHGLHRTWDVYDAEERRVGLVYRNGLWDEAGTRLASILRHAAADHGHFVAAAETELAAFDSQPRGIVLRFRPVLEGKPFARMAVLAAVLSW